MLNSSSTRIYDALDAGCGKTACTYLYANTLGLKRHLIVAPATLRLNWKREFKLWSRYQNKPVVILSGDDAKSLYYKIKNNELPKGSLTLIISYNLLSGYEEQTSKRNRKRSPSQFKKYVNFLKVWINTREWDLITCDEHHEARSITSKRAQILRDLFPKSRYVMLLSASPLMNTALDMFPALHEIIPHTTAPKLHKALAGDFLRYASKFTFSKNTLYGKKYFGFRNQPLLKKIIKSNGFFFRKTQEEVLPELPELSFERLDLYDVPAIETTKDPELLRTYKKLLSADDSRIKDLQNNKAMSSLRREIGQAKAESEELFNFILYRLEVLKRPCVIFAYHRTALHTLMDKFSKFRPSYLDGSISPTKKEAQVARFMNGKSDLFIGQLKAGGVGLNLFRASECFNIEPDWLPELLRQAAKRLHRIGQKHNVTAHCPLSVNNPLDKLIMTTLIKKAKNISKILDAKKIK